MLPAILTIAGIVWLAYEIATAPEGYETDRGFHHGTPDTGADIYLAEEVRRALHPEAYDEAVRFESQAGQLTTSAPPMACSFHSNDTSAELQRDHG